VEERVVGLLQRNHPVAAPRQQCRGGTAGRATADDHYVALFGRRFNWVRHTAVDDTRILAADQLPPPSNIGPRM
jgi:hypothetical protein